MAQGSLTMAGPLAKVFVPRRCADRSDRVKPELVTVEERSYHYHTDKWVAAPPTVTGNTHIVSAPPDVAAVKETVSFQWLLARNVPSFHIGHLLKP